MPSFADFSNTLPDPINKIGYAGQLDLSTGQAGPGFLGVSVSSSEPVMKERFNSQRSDKDLGYHHIWEIDITYNPMTCEEFYPVYAFLGYRRATMQPFYVAVPPYSTQTTVNMTVASATNKKAEKVTATGIVATPGSMITFDNHTKVYLITRVETDTEYNTQDTAVSAGTQRLHITPHLQKALVGGEVINFNAVKFLVVQKEDNTTYSLNDKNLYSFKLNLEEVNAG